MKVDQKNLFLQVLLNSFLLISFALSGVVSYSSGSHIDRTINTESFFKISLSGSILIILVFALANFLFIKFYKQLRDESHIDFLTGFISRYAFINVLKKVLLQSNRTLEPLSVILTDIDHFKILNEKYGYQAGDELLKILSKAIRLTIGDSDLICRWDSNQILIVLKNCTTRNACRIAKKIMKKTGGPHLLSSGESIRFTTSNGVAQMISTDDTLALVTRAETGLHTARDNGRNTCAVGYEWILIDYICNPILPPA
ncbi:MAG TPA: GGDEF domain-containing protein [Desulfobacterales bacterium]|nr:GGDEF domain-containing protein [Desulfobacterales bacterium]HIP39526.1 GGDEF domain-containing protein [Desulfocapsa sulfexigens]